MYRADSGILAADSSVVVTALWWDVMVLLSIIHKTVIQALDTASQSNQQEIP